MSEPKRDGEKKPRYIDAEKLSKQIEGTYLDGDSALSFHADSNGDTLIGKMQVLDIISDQSDVDVQEVRHGYWIDTTAYCGEFTCSICKETCVANKYKYCPHCGAKMDGRDEENGN